MNDNADWFTELSEEESERLRSLMIEAGWDNLSEEELGEEISKTLQILIEQGDVERLVGEDGQFYYRKVRDE